LALILGLTFLTTSQIKVATLLAIMYTKGVLFVREHLSGMLSGCFNLLPLRTGQRLGFVLSDNKVIVWPFWQFFWMRHPILTELAMSKDESSIISSWHLDLSKKAKSLVVTAFMTWWPDG
jgi:hypothetical protein